MLGLPPAFFATIFLVIIERNIPNSAASILNFFMPKFYLSQHFIAIVLPILSAFFAQLHEREIVRFLTHIRWNIYESILLI